ncbi:MAG: PASTA domain-containing protein, partial [Clostridiales bacterium]|nr:PASTA domain-containing protein [Clostridiales bacterium]
VISRGMKIVTPDFAGKTEAECSTIGRDAGLTILYDYQYSGSVPTGYVISQSYAKNTIITDADTITIVISLGTP